VRDIWRLSGIAVVFIVLLRVAIGWQFVYEGLWKLNTFSSAKPWTSAGYLRNARGPLRNFYRGMTGDPDDLHWLDYDQVAASWDAYRDAFVTEHPDLTEAQKLRLSEMLAGPAQFAVPLAKLPAGVKIAGNLAKVISYDADNKQLVVDGKQHLLPKEKAELEHMAKSAKNANPAETQRFVKALDQVFRQSAKLSLKERLAVLLKIDPERVGIVYRDDKTKEVVEERKGKITEYKEMLARYEDELPRARQTFELQHLDVQWGEVQKLRAELVNPIRSLDTDFKQETRKLLSAEQLARGPVPERWTPQQRIDHLTIWALIAIGGLLMVGLLSRVSAIAAAGLLLSFYLAIPPWPGVEELLETAGPEHSFIVNKNLIEVIALLAIACLPTGQWFGLDRLVLGLVPGKRRTANPAPPSVSK
jgi:uncharacterized membrane protein YphA (DoxX/SURF4 family)